MRKSNLKCCLCKKEIVGPRHPHTNELIFETGEYIGNNPYPLVAHDDYDSRCCDLCDCTMVLPARMGMDPFDEDLEKRQQAMSFGISIWKARIEGRKMAFEHNESPSPIYINKDDPMEQLDPLGKPIGRLGEKE